MTAQTSEGVQYAIALGEPATQDQAGYEALTYTTVGELTDIPEYGGDTTVVTLDTLANGITQKYKGQTNFGSQALTGARDTDDAGQVIIKAGVKGGANENARHSVRITLPDGATDYYFGKPFNYKTNIGAANNIIMFNTTFELESAVLQLAAP